MSVSPLRRRVRHVRTTEAFMAFAAWAQVPEAVARAAMANIIAGDVVALLSSGAQGSGKDSVCPAVFDALGITSSVQCRVAHAIRAEMADILALIEAASSREQAVVEIERCFDVSPGSAGLYVDLFFDATRDANHGVHVHARTESMRRALQWHGAEARSHQIGYWVKKTYQDVIPNLADGVSVYLTDGRFPAEVDAGRTTGALCVRLWVPEEVRVERIRSRDGIVPSLATLRHPGEVALDGYWGLDAELDNSGDLAATVACVAQLLLEHRDALRHMV